MSALVFRAFRAEGYDQAIPKSGPLVYSIDTRLTTHDGAIRIYPVNDTDTHHLHAPMSVGETISVGKVSITYLSGSADGDAIEVRVGQ
jgi:hypothetical protein